MSGEEDLFETGDQTSILDDSSNNGSSGSGGSEYYDEPSTFFISMDSVKLTIRIIGIILNSFIISYIITTSRKNLKKMSTYHFLLLLLAIIDWSICMTDIFNILLELEVIPYIEVLDFLNVLTTPLQLQSMFGLFFVSLLRYQSIVHPFRTKWTKRRYFIFSLATLIISLLIYLPNTMSYAMDLGVVMSFFDKYTNHIDTSISFLFLVILIVLYFKMRKVMKESQESRSKERNEKALKTLRILLTMFAVTMVLVKIIILSIDESIPQSYVQEMSDVEIAILNIVSLLLTEIIFLNNVGNFFIYLKMMPEFRCYMRNLLCCSCCQRR